MTTTQDATSRLTIQANTVGVTEATESLNKLAMAQGGIAVSSSNVERSTLSLDKSFSNLERRFSSSLRNQQDYEKIVKQVNTAVGQNPALQERANAVLASAADRYNQVGGAQKAFSLVSERLNFQIASLASGMGLTGQILSAFGPAGFAAAVGIGAVESALSYASNAAHELAQKSKEIFEFSEAVGLSTTQFQALKSAAGKFGIDSEALAGGLSKFTAGFEQLRNGTGSLFTEINRINPEIAKQMQLTRDAATAFTLFGKAVSETDNIFQRNQLLKAGMGKGSAIFGGFFESAPDVSALTKAFEDAGKGIDENLIKKLKQLEIDINKTAGAAKSVFSQLFGTATLQQELEFQRGLLVIATTLKEMKLSDGFGKFLDVISNPAVQGLLAGLLGGAAAGGMLGAVFGGVGALPGAIAGGALGAGAGFMGGAAVTGIRQLGAGAGSSFDDRFQFDASRPSSNYVGRNDNFAKPEVTELSLAAQAAASKALTSVLGSAASESEKFNSSLLDMQIRAKDAGISGDVLSRAIAGLRLDTAIAAQNNHNAALGQSVTIQDQVAVRMLALQKLQMAGAGLTRDQVAFQRQLTETQALGTFQIDAQTNAEKLKIDTLFMSTQAGISYTIVQTKINEANAKGAPLNDNQVASLRKSADAFASAKVKADDYSAALSTAYSSIDSGLVTGLTDIVSGTKNASTAFGDMSKIIVRAIEEMIVKLLIIKPLMASLGGLNFGGLFGGGSPSGYGTASAQGNVFSGGNVIPFARGGVIDGPMMAPMALMGEAGPEAIVPLRRGPDGNLGIMQQGNAGGSVNAPINVTIDARGADEAGTQRVMQQLEQLKAELPARVVVAVTQARKMRQL